MRLDKFDDSDGVFCCQRSTHLSLLSRERERSGCDWVAVGDNDLPSTDCIFFINSRNT